MNNVEVARRIPQGIDVGTSKVSLIHEGRGARAVESAGSTDSKEICRTASIRRYLGLRTWPACFHSSPDAAAGAEHTFDNGPNWVCRLNDVFQHLVHDVFLKDAEIAVTEEILLERFQFEAFVTGHVTNGEDAEVGESGLGANGGHFGVVYQDFIAGKLILPDFNGREVEIEASLGVVVGVAPLCCHGSIVKNGNHWVKPVSAADINATLRANSRPIY